MEITLSLGEIITYGGLIVAVVGGYAELKWRGIGNSKRIDNIESKAVPEVAADVEKIIDRIVELEKKAGIFEATRNLRDQTYIGRRNGRK